MAKPIQGYSTEEYASLGLPIGPAIIIGNELLVQRRDIDEEELDDAVCRHLGLPEPGCWGGSRQNVGCFYHLTF